MHTMRTALVTGAQSAKQVWAYLPDNYSVLAFITTEDGKTEYLIGGYDNAGWTLDGYVIPRLASGLIWATPTEEIPSKTLDFLQELKS